MNISEMKKLITNLKQNSNTAILAHSYQSEAILEVADFIGDSYKLSVDAKNINTDNILFCGVHFMAETAKMLSPDKHVFLANPNAGCPMAEQMDADIISQLKQREPDRTIVAYINTTASLKAVCDVCVTSSSAVKIVNRIKNDKILFIPDCNLGDYVRRQLPEKDIMLLQGGCPVHASVTVADVIAAKAEHPNALLLVHPECIPQVVEKADYVGSTSGIMQYAIHSDAHEFIIGTELSIVEHLQYACPDREFFPLSKKILCPNMKLTTLPDVYRSLIGISSRKAVEIVMDDELIFKARRCIDEMIRLGD